MSFYDSDAVSSTADIEAYLLGLLTDGEFLKRDGSSLASGAAGAAGGGRSTVSQLVIDQYPSSRWDGATNDSKHAATIWTASSAESAGTSSANGYLTRISSASATAGQVFWSGAATPVIDGKEAHALRLHVLFSSSFIGNEHLRIGMGRAGQRAVASPDVSGYPMICIEQTSGDSTARLYVVDNFGTTGETGSTNILTPASGNWLMAAGGEYIFDFARSPSGTDTVTLTVYNTDGTTVLASASTTANIPYDGFTDNPAYASFFVEGKSSDATARYLYLWPGECRVERIVS